MSDHEPSNIKQNVILFPKLADRLLEKGVASIKRKKYSEAMSYFKQLYQLEPNHPQASFGLAVCYVELGAYEEAEELTEQMLKQDVGHYFDVLKLHISVLIQRRQYEKVIQIIDAVISEGEVPSEIAISLKQLEEFCKKRLQENPTQEETDEIPSYEQFYDLKGEEDEEDFSSLLMSEQIEQQWTAIQKAQFYIDHKRADALQDFLIHSEGDPFLKTLAIKLIKDERPEMKHLDVLKYGQTFKVNLEDEGLFNDEIAEAVSHVLSDHLEQNNPTLYDMTMQIWEHFIIASFPLPINHLSEWSWACACYIYAEEINGGALSETEMITQFGANHQEVMQALELLKQVEQGSTHIGS